MPGTDRRDRVPAAAVRLVLIALLLLGCLTRGVGSARAQEQPVVVEAIEVRGNVRTPRATVDRYLPLRAGDRVPPDSLVAAVEELRESGLFQSVAFTSRRGTERGHVVLDLEVTERRIEFRLGAGYEDLSGWYLIPAQLQMDNRFGQGERLRLQFRVGYRTVGLHLNYEQPRFGDGKNHWGAGLSTEGLERVYFLNDVPYGHELDASGFEAHLGRRLTPSLTLEAGLGVTEISVDSTAEASADNRRNQIAMGEELPYEELPAGVARAVGSRTRGQGRLDLVWDTRAALRVAATPVSGAWGRLRFVHSVDDEGGYPALSADLRGYRRLGPLALAARGRAGLLGRRAPFYDRFYVGGPYSLRGFPNASETPPDGDTRFWASSLELRGRMSGPIDNPRLTGLLFVDAAQSWDRNAPRLDDISVGAGWGMRWRVGWLGWIGVDVGVPLTPSPVDEAFHVHGSLGLSF